jgi:hypothetical protein
MLCRESRPSKTAQPKFCISPRPAEPAMFLAVTSLASARRHHQTLLGTGRLQAGSGGEALSYWESMRHSAMYNRPLQLKTDCRVSSQDCWSGVSRTEFSVRDRAKIQCVSGV